MAGALRPRRRRGLGVRVAPQAVRRLRADGRQDLIDRVVSGGLPSWNAAAIEAGHRHRTITVRCDDMVRAAATLRRHQTDEQVTELVRELSNA